MGITYGSAEDWSDTTSLAQKFWDEQAEWSQATFGSDTERGPLGPLKHLEKEAKEAQDSADMYLRRVTNDPRGTILLPTEALQDCMKTEIADCLFLTFDAARRAGMTLNELLDTAFHKLEINKQRKWNKPTDDNPVEHVRD